jgi:hypothetical protein
MSLSDQFQRFGLDADSGEVTFLRPKGRPKSDTICNVQKRKRHDLVVEN